MRLGVILSLFSLSFYLGCAKSSDRSSLPASATSEPTDSKPSETSRIVAQKLRPVDRTDVKNSVIGVWTSSEIEDHERGIDHFRDFVIEDGFVSLYLTCVYKSENAVQAIIKTRAKIEKEQIEILEDGFDKANFKGEICAGAVPKGSVFKYRYEADSDILIFVNADQTELSLDRALGSTQE